MKPRITVLMPVYNAERFLHEAIDSILNQSFEDFEFIIIDDGSTDSSAEIVQSYTDNRIRFFRNPINLGISKTLNKGIKLATSTMIARMDADDISYPKRLQKQYDYMMSHPQCALLSTWCRVVTEDRKFVRLERYRSNFYYYNLTFECWMYHPTIMFRKAPVEKVGLYSMPYSEDYDLFWKVSTQFEIGNLMEPLLDYRLSSTSLNTVLRKKEYDIANEENVLRNIRFYMGEKFNVSNETLECLRHNFKPLAAKNSIVEIFQCFNTLEQITEKILQRPNVNRDEASIRSAFYFKKKFMLTELGRALPGSSSVELLIRANAWMTLYMLTIHSLGWRLRRVMRTFF